jgi:hypothetical protein
MDLGTIMQLGSFGLGLFGSFSSRNAANRQATYSEQEAALNRRIGAFNAEIAERTGAESVQAIARQTKRTIGAQKNEFARRGISMEGSPMFVMGDTLTMGSKQAQEAYFNAQVNKINALHGAYKYSSADMKRAEDSRMSAMSSNIDIFKQFIEGARGINSAFAAAKATQPTGSRLVNSAFQQQGQSLSGLLGI